MTKLSPIHPGEILYKEFLAPCFVTPKDLADSTSLPLDTIMSIIYGKTGITEYIAEILGAFFETGSIFWLNLQKSYDERSV